MAPRLFILLLVVGAASAAALPGRDKLARLRQANVHQSNLPRAVNAMQFASSISPGDIIVGGLLNVLGVYSSTLFVLNGTTFEQKGTLSSALDPYCAFVDGGFAISPDNSQLMVVCDAASNLPSSNIVAINTTDLTSSIFATMGGLPDAVQLANNALYKPSGDLLVAADQSTPDDFTVWNVLLQYNSTADVTAFYNMSVATSAFLSLDLTPDASEVLYAAMTPDLLSFDLECNVTQGPVFTANNSICMSVVTLLDNTRLVGCAVTGAGFCAFHVTPLGYLLPGRAWCTPAADLTPTDLFFGYISLAMDIDRRSFLVMVGDYTATSDYHNVFRISMRDFTQEANATVPAFLWGQAKVFGAVPASQQTCGRGRCCTPAGLFAAAGTPCRSKDPCILDDVCDGTSARCPSRKKADDGCLCSREPWGLFRPAQVDKGMSDEEAADKGYHKCGKCSFGFCVPPQHEEEQHKLKHHHSKHPDAAHHHDGSSRRLLLEGGSDSVLLSAELQGHKHHKGRAWCKADEE